MLELGGLLLACEWYEKRVRTPIFIHHDEEVNILCSIACELEQYRILYRNRVPVGIHCSQKGDALLHALSLHV